MGDCFVAPRRGTNIRLHFRSELSDWTAGRAGLAETAGFVVERFQNCGPGPAIAAALKATARAAERVSFEKIFIGDVD